MKLKDLGILPKEKKFELMNGASISKEIPGNSGNQTLFDKIKGYNQARQEDNEVEIEVDVVEIEEIIMDYYPIGHQLDIDFACSKNRTLAQAIAKALPTILRRKDGT